MQLPNRRELEIRRGPEPVIVRLAGLFAVLSATVLSAQGGSPCAPQVVADEVTLSSGGGANPDAALFEDGSGIVVWSGVGTSIGDDSRTAIIARRLDAAGNPAGDLFVVNTVTEQDQARPRVAAAPNGRFVVVWQSDVSPGDDERRSIRARTHGPDGTPIGPDFQVNTATEGDQIEADVAMADDGTFVVVWEDGAFSDRGNEVKARLFNTDGSPRGGELVVNDFTDDGQSEPAVAMAPDGRFVVTWTSRGGPGNDSGFSIQARIFDAGGNPVANQFQVNTTTRDTQATPAIAMDPDGTFLIAWRSDVSDESDQDGRSIHARGYLINGAAVGTQKQINERTTNNQTTPYVAAAGGREFLIVWESNENTLNPSIQARAVTLEGQPLGIEFNVGESGDTSGVNPGVGGNGAGRTIALWTPGSAVLGTVYDLPCVTGGGVTDCTEDATTLCLTGDRFRVTVLWEDQSGKRGVGQAVELTPDTGYFWFFDSANVETVIKVLDACGFNDRFWVFVGGLTDLRIDFLVEDVETSVIRRYQNPQGVAFDTINDTSAFDTCP
ncbi:MAG TPA: hypothetical protein VMT85_08520 [Thermoanaerobaculia bacterium]|nr:hypothetical protein [Thermoanaerobaculia bacterium]